MINRALQILTSLKLTVVCLAVAMILVFVGTIAQVDEGLYAAQERYFKSFLIYWEPTAPWRIPIFPGGYAVGIVLLVNLIAAHAKRFQFTKKKIGIFLTHAGLILLLLGQLLTDLLSRESALNFYEGETKNYSVDFRKNELVLIDKSAADTDTVISIPESRLRKDAVLSDANLPFQIKIHEYWPNAQIIDRNTTDALATTANRGTAKHFRVMPLQQVTEMDKRDLPCAVVELLDSKRSLGIWLAAASLKPQPVQHGDKTFDLALRFRRYYEPFTLTLLRATHEEYKGTDRPKNFSSRVQLKNKNTNENREVLIYMNHPLRYGGLTFYQHQMAAGKAVRQKNILPNSTLQVVRNPAWLTPYLACFMVGAGLLIQFLTHLVGFLRKQKQKPAKTSKREPAAKPRRKAGNTPTLATRLAEKKSP